MQKLTDESIVTALIEYGEIKTASKVLGCSVRTIYRRQNDKAFQALYAKAKTALVRDVCSKMQSMMLSASEVLQEIMLDAETPKQTRVNCAVAILQNALKLTETVDIIGRVEQLESTVNEE